MCVPGRAQLCQNFQLKSNYILRSAFLDRSSSFEITTRGRKKGSKFAFLKKRARKELLNSTFSCGGGGDSGAILYRFSSLRLSSFFSQTKRSFEIYFFSTQTSFKLKLFFGNVFLWSLESGSPSPLLPTHTPTKTEQFELKGALPLFRKRLVVHNHQKRHLATY